MSTAPTPPLLFQHTHQPEGRCDLIDGCQGRTTFLFQHTHQPEGRCDRHLPPRPPSPPSFNTRTSPKAGATLYEHRAHSSAPVSTHAPARRPVRPHRRLPGPHDVFVSTHAPARRPVRPSFATSAALTAEFQHTHQPEGRCDAGGRWLTTGVNMFQHTHQPEGRCDRLWTSMMVLPCKFQHTHQPEGRCDPRQPT